MVMFHRRPGLQEQNQVLKLDLLVAAFQELHEERIAVFFVLNVGYVHLKWKDTCDTGGKD